MENLSVTMVRSFNTEIPQHSIPIGLQLVNKGKEGAAWWTKIHEEAEKFVKVDDQLFFKEFEKDFEGLKDRAFYAFDPFQNRVVGTATAWYNDYKGEPWGQVHWVAVSPTYQGQGVAKGLVTEVMNRLAKDHDKIFLRTSSARPGAIKIYLDFGFLPELNPPSPNDAVIAPKAWNHVCEQLDHPILKKWAEENLK